MSVSRQQGQSDQEQSDRRASSPVSGAPARQDASRDWRGKLTVRRPLDLVLQITKKHLGEAMLTDWRLAAAAAIFCTGLLVTCIETSAQSMPKDVATRTEVYAIPSLTISDQQFLTGASRSPSPANSASRRAAENYPS